jgi:hypothetical protein
VKTAALAVAVVPGGNRPFRLTHWTQLRACLFFASHLFHGLTKCGEPKCGQNDGGNWHDIVQQLLTIRIICWVSFSGRRGTSTHPWQTPIRFNFRIQILIRTETDPSHVVEAFIITRVM